MEDNRRTKELVSMPFHAISQCAPRQVISGHSAAINLIGPFILFLSGCAAPSVVEVSPTPALPRVAATNGMTYPTDTTPLIQAERLAVVSIEFDQTTVRIAVRATQCMQPSDFLPRIRRSDINERSVQLILTRVTSETCASQASVTLLLEYSLGSLGIRQDDEIRFLNPFVAYIGPAEIRM